MKFYRKIIGEKYGLISIPKPVFDQWTELGLKGFEMNYDEATRSLVITPRIEVN